MVIRLGSGNGADTGALISMPQIYTLYRKKKTRMCYIFETTPGEKRQKPEKGRIPAL
jgi:hypothetical protein